MHNIASYFEILFHRFFCVSSTLNREYVCLLYFISPKSRESENLTQIAEFPPFSHHIEWMGDRTKTKRGIETLPKNVYRVDCVSPVFLCIHSSSLHLRASTKTKNVVAVFYVIR